MKYNLFRFECVYVAAVFISSCTETLVGVVVRSVAHIFKSYPISMRFGFDHLNKTNQISMIYNMIRCVRDGYSYYY